MKTPTRLLAVSAAALLLTSCQAPATSPAPAAATPMAPSDAPFMAVLAEGGPALPALRELDAVAIEAPLRAPLTMTVEYRRGVEEEVSWEGTGHGVAELKNQYGQLVYRVKEGEPARRLTVPAGSYTLTITPDAAQAASPMMIQAMPTERGVQVRTLTDLAENGGPDDLARGPQDPCGTLTRTLKRLADLERAIQFSRQPARHYPEYDAKSREELVREYDRIRVWVDRYYTEWRGVIRESCGEEMLKHQPADKMLSIALAWLSPYLYTYYMNNF